MRDEIGRLLRCGQVPHLDLVSTVADGEKSAVRGSGNANVVRAEPGNLSAFRRTGSIPQRHRAVSTRRHQCFAIP